MADVKISALPGASTPLTGAEIVPIVQSGTTDQVSVANLTAGRSVAASTLNVDANTANAAVRVTQTGAGNALLVEDSTNPDATPFVVNASGQVLIGRTTAPFGSTQLGIEQISNNTNPAFQDFLKNRAGATIATGDGVGQLRFWGYDGTSNEQVAAISATAEGTINTGDVPGRISFSTRQQSTASVSERVRINNTGDVGIGNFTLTGYNLRLQKSLTGAVTSRAMLNSPTIQSDVTTSALVYEAQPATTSVAFTLTTLTYFQATQGSFGAGSAVTNQFGFNAGTNLIGATTNYGFYADNTAAVTAGKTSYGFYSNVNTATGGGTTWGFYGAGTAPNFFAGDMRFDKTVTAAGTTGAQTINKNAGTVNFAAAATSLVVTNSRVTANSIIIATVATSDATMKTVIAVAGAGSFTLTANAAATAETRVNWLVIN
jgi:hypothetical protein